MKNVNKDNLLNVVGKNIKYYRERYEKIYGKKMTQEILAEKVNVSTRTIGNIESNKPKYGLNIRTLCDIASVLEIPVSLLLNPTLCNDFVLVDIDSSNIYQVIGKNIKYYRYEYIQKHECDFDQEDLAKKAGVSQDTIAVLECSDPRCGVTLKTLCKIADALEVPVHNLLEKPLL